MEAKLDGYQQRVALFPHMLKENLNIEDLDQVINLMADFFDSLTGGSFGSSARQIDITRSKLVYSNGSALIGRLRKTKPKTTLTSIALTLTIFAGLLYILFYPHSKSIPPGWIRI